MKSLFTILAALFMAAAPASAADLFRGGSIKDTPGVSYTEAPINWNGFYLGIQGGYGNANHALDAEIYNAEESATLASLDGVNGHGFIGGARVGYDFQLGRFVAGPFADYNFSNIETELKMGDHFTATVEKGEEWTIGGRAGVLLSQSTLLYGLAGYTETSYSLHASGEGKLGDQDFTGLTAGVGLETAITRNIFLSLEYQHRFYDDETVFDTGDCGGECTGLRLKDELSEDIVMGRVSVKLNGGLLGY